MPDYFYISKEGFKKLQSELHELKSVDRPAIAQLISDARDFGDLKENAEYHAAKEKMALLEDKITQLEERVRRARVIDPKTISTEQVAIYTAVSLKDMTRNMEVRYSLVSQDESDFRQFKISVDSPVAKALLGKKVGDVVDIKVPAGMMKYEVLKIEPANL